MKVLTGEGYTQARLAGILHEAWVTRIGHTVTNGNTVYGHGTITTNSITSEVGLIVDQFDPYYALPEIHASRLIDVVEGDGWIPTESE